MTRVAAAAGLTVTAAIALLLVLDGPAELVAFEALLAVLAVLAVRWLAPLSRQAGPRSAGRRPKRAAATSPPDLQRLERLIRFSAATAFDAERRLTPLLSDLARAHLGTYHRVDLDADADCARALLGADTWRLLRPGSRRGGDQWGPGVDLGELEAAVSSLEQLGRERP